MPEAPEETYKATVVKAKPTPQKLEFVGVDPNYPEGKGNMWNISKDIVDPSGAVLHPAGSTVNQATLEGYGLKVPKAPKPKVAEVPAKAPEPVSKPVEAPKPVETPPVVQKAPELKEQPAIKAPEGVIEQASVKVGDQKQTIYKKADGSWYDGQGNVLSGGSKQFAIDKLKQAAKTSAKGSAIKEMPKLASEVPAKALTPDQTSAETSAKAPAKIEAPKSKSILDLADEGAKKQAQVAPEKKPKRVSVDDLDAIEEEAIQQAKKKSSGGDAVPSFMAATQTKSANVGRIVKMMGDKLYSANTAKTTGKELVQNAIDATMAAGGEKTIYYGSEDDKFYIADSGGGMTPERSFQQARAVKPLGRVADWDWLRLPFLEETRNGRLLQSPRIRVRRSCQPFRAQVCPTSTTSTTLRWWTFSQTLIFVWPMA
jgi:hypothetical protein